MRVNGPVRLNPFPCGIEFYWMWSLCSCYVFYQFNYEKAKTIHKRIASISVLGCHFGRDEWCVCVCDPIPYGFYMLVPMYSFSVSSHFFLKLNRCGVGRLFSSRNYDYALIFDYRHMGKCSCVRNAYTMREKRPTRNWGFTSRRRIRALPFILHTAPEYCSGVKFQCASSAFQIYVTVVYTVSMAEKDNDNLIITHFELQPKSCAINSNHLWIFSAAG